MHRIDDPNATPENLFTEGDPISGTPPATKITDDWLNDLQEEICNVIEEAGITLVKGTRDQLVDAIVALAKSGTLTGYTSGAGTVAGTDTILQAIQKLNGNVALKADTAGPSFTGTVALTQSGKTTKEYVGTATTTAAGSAQTMLTIATATGGCYTIEATFTAKNTTDNKYYSRKIIAAARNIAGTLTIGTPVELFEDFDSVFPAIKPTFSVSTTNILIVSGDYITKDAEWMCSVKVDGPVN